MRCRLLFAVMVLVGRARGDTGAVIASSLFDEGKRLAAAGNWTLACVKFDASYRADAAAGTLLNLADCHEHVGKTASAWVEFKDAADKLAHGHDGRETFAQKRAAALEPKLVRLRVLPPPVSIDGLVVKRDGIDVTAALGTAIPVDPGPFLISAAAPNRWAWAQVVVAPSQGATDVKVPSLDAANGPHTLPSEEMGQHAVRMVGDMSCRWTGADGKVGPSFRIHTNLVLNGFWMETDWGDMQVFVTYDANVKQWRRQRFWNNGNNIPGHASGTPNALTWDEDSTGWRYVEEFVDSDLHITNYASNDGGKTRTVYATAVCIHQ